ncbi:ParB N-terminal domain-containing protein [Cereibacter sphaeroides]|uniref:ParB N-terminal domain-containing protein n=1 Tax=Cereibacter sphaeroides TaxID=1063 RepID=UPI001F28AB26|nr:ParB N-terminal domain-containing protein [Cereibacter sphaeroides]MCE6949952.1 ParB N-terminal domain-containing protein [Cereibacter sphaeroides]
MKKRRMFDIDLPPDASVSVPAAEPPQVSRRGPMATAIGENAESLRQRQQAEAAIRAENDALAHEFVRLKKLGLVTDLIPLDRIEMTLLIRDRSRRRDDEIDELKASIREIGLSNPICVSPRGQGYELVQGFRRLSAYRELFEETGDDVFARIPAALMPQGETLEGLYRRMVDENLVRRDLSFWEMASFARAYAADPETDAADVDAAVAQLFRTSNRQKKIYIRHFATLVGALEDSLNFPEAIPRALGLALVRRLEDEPTLAASLAAALRAANRASAEDELAVLRRFFEAGAGDVDPPSPVQVKPLGGARKGKITFRIARPEGEARCSASPGRLELRLERDFSAIERRRLEAAVAAFFKTLDG